MERDDRRVHGPLPADPALVEARSRQVSSSGRGLPREAAPSAWWLLRESSDRRWTWTAGGESGAAPDSAPPSTAPVAAPVAIAPAPLADAARSSRSESSPTTHPDVLELSPVHVRNPERILARWDRVLPMEAGRSSTTNPGPARTTSGSAEIRETLTLAGSGVLAPYLSGSRQGEDAYASAFGCSIEGAAGLCLRPFASVEYRLQIAQEFMNQVDVPSRDSELSVELRLNF